LRELSAKKRIEFYINNTGKKHSVLFESVKEDDFIYGFTDNYIKVRAQAKAELENTIHDFEITEVNSPNFAEGIIK
jgi:threonylcarbamoyladenosine tRNA methylthiotransferase MtaB